MYRIMLADDEGIVVDSFTYILKEEFGDEVVIEAAKTGRSVIELAERFRPDIALMDIRMPGINGIDAIKEIRKRNTGIIFIVISAYDKFGYAQEAINQGVMDYLNKPVDRNQLVMTVRKAMEQVDREREKRSRELEILEKMETVTPIIESGLIYNMLFQDLFKEDLENFKKILEIDTDYGYMLALVFGEQQEGSVMTNAVGTSVRIQNHIRDLREIIKSYFHGIVGPVMANKIAIFIPYDKKEFDYNERIEIIDTARNDLAIGCDYEEDYPIDLEETIFESVRKGDINKSISSAGQFFEWMRESYGGYSEDIKLKTLEFVLRAESLAYQKSGNTYRFRSREDYLGVINSVPDYDSLKKWFLDKISDACHTVMSRRENRSSSVIDRARDYIMAHYKKDISLDDVSREVDISPYYFSKIFKEATGENFIEYLTNLRIEKAKELLDNTEMSMKEICLEVGYSNPNYFSRIFKKSVGVSPTEYKG